jgi:alcohol dehydrogenase
MLLLTPHLLAALAHEFHLNGRHKEKMRMAEKAGVDTRIAGKKRPTLAYDWVVDATGSQKGLEEAVRMSRPRATVFMKSTVHGLVRIDTAPIVVNEITLVGSRCGRFEPALKLLESGRVNVLDMISDCFPLQQARRAFARAAERGVLKVLLTN